MRARAREGRGIAAERPAREAQTLEARKVTDEPGVRESDAHELEALERREARERREVEAPGVCSPGM